MTSTLAGIAFVALCALGTGLAVLGLALALRINMKGRKP